MSKTFLTAQWRKLAMANYCVDSHVLEPLIPYGTELDTWSGTHYLSLVGFMFLDTRVKGLRIPWHAEFEEVNLRFYVRRRDGAMWKRGVVFVREIVPKRSLTWVANAVYGEHYQTLQMDHSWQTDDRSLYVEYRWKKVQWNRIRVQTSNMARPVVDGTEEEFITEHYWGYTRLGRMKTSEYEVRHPRWDVYETMDYSIDVDFGEVYGRPFAFLTQQTPRSVFVAEGSPISVEKGRRL